MNHLLTAAAVLLLIHGIVELTALFAFVSPSYRPSFIFEELSLHWAYAVWVGVISGLVRVLSAAGILAQRRWGWALGLAISGTTLVTLTLYLPFGIMDAALSWAVVSLLLMSHYRGARIGE